MFALSAQAQGTCMVRKKTTGHSFCPCRMVAEEILLHTCRISSQICGFQDRSRSRSPRPVRLEWRWCWKSFWLGEKQRLSCIFYSLSHACMHARCRNCFIAVVLLNQGSGTGYGGNILVMTEPAASNTAATLIRFSKGDTHGLDHRICTCAEEAARSQMLGPQGYVVVLHACMPAFFYFDVLEYAHGL